MISSDAEMNHLSEEFDLAPDAYISDLLGFQPGTERYNVADFDSAEAPMLISQLVPRGSRVLDVGCGTGCVTDLIRRERAADVFGVEPDVGRAVIARGLGFPVEAGYLNEKLAERIGLFDVVILADVLEHCMYPGHLLRLAIKFLRPEGKIIISVPNIAHWSIRQSLLFGNFNYSATGILDATHIRWFTKMSLMEFLGRIGLEVKGIRYSAGTTLPVYWRQAAFRILPAGIKIYIIKRLAIRFPTLFACQFVVSAGVASSVK